MTTLSAEPIPFQPGAVGALQRTFRGPLHLPGESGYDTHRATWSGRIDPRPALVARATNAADVRAALLTARDYELDLAVQSTGHGTHVACDGGLLLKTSAMAEVLVDPDRRIARVGPGARWSQVIEAAAPFGLAPLSGTNPTVGVTGYTLGGGVSWLSRRFGFAADSVVRAEVVLADGRQVTASADASPDLFWALRGAGANFGVVTGLEFRLHPVAQLFGGSALFAIERAPEVLARYRDYAPAMPDALTATVVLLNEPGGPVLAIRGAYAGAPEDARRALAPLLDVAGAPLADSFRSMAYADTATIGGTAPRSFELFEQLSDAVIEEIVDLAPHVEGIDVRLWGGAMARQDLHPGPIGHRDVPFSITVNGDPGAVAPLRAHAAGGSFLNFLHDPARTHTAYSAPDLARLRVLKAAYDPDNVFGRTHNIAPAQSRVAFHSANTPPSSA